MRNAAVSRVRLDEQDLRDMDALVRQAATEVIADSTGPTDSDWFKVKLKVNKIYEIDELSEAFDLGRPITEIEWAGAGLTMMVHVNTSTAVMLWHREKGSEQSEQILDILRRRQVDRPKVWPWALLTYLAAFIIAVAVAALLPDRVGSPVIIGSIAGASAGIVASLIVRLQARRIEDDFNTSVIINNDADDSFLRRNHIELNLGLVAVAAVAGVAALFTK